MGLIIAGDLVPSRDDIECFVNGDINSLLGDELADIWNKSENKIFNLEAPLINGGNPILKCGPNLKINEECINGIRKLNPSLIMLANNHIMDYGVDGLNKTIDILNYSNINYVGVGNSLNEIKKYHTLIVDSKKVAIYNCAEQEFSIATNSNPGAYAYNESEIISDLVTLKKDHDFIIVIYHGGKEEYRYPSPKLRRRSNIMIKYGANMVVCQHSHCIGCMEKIDGNYIIYGQGNFLFNLEDNEYWNTSLLLDVTFDTKLHLKCIPVAKKDCGITILNNEAGKSILSEFKLRSNEINEKDFVEKKYDELSNKLIDEYICALHGNKLFFRLLNKITNRKCLKYYYNKYDYAKILNYIECEAHNELIVNGLKNKIHRN